MSKSYKILSVSPKLREIDDSSSQMLLKAWDEHNCSGKIYVEENENVGILGYLLLKQAGAKCSVAGIFVLPAYRSRGIATHLLDEACQDCSLEGRYIIAVVPGSLQQLFVSKGFTKQEVKYLDVFTRGDVSEVELDKLKKKYRNSR